MDGGGLIVIALLFALFWLFLIRPQRRRQVEQQRMLAAIEVGDEIVTAGGIYGAVVALEDDEVRVEIAPGTQVRVARRAIAAVLEDDEEDEEREGLEEDATDTPVGARLDESEGEAEPSARER